MLGNLLRQPGGTVFQGLLAAPQGQHVAHAGPEFGVIDGLGEEVVGAGFEGSVAGFLLMVRRDHQQRDVRVQGVGAKSTDELKAIGGRHHVVHDHHVRDIRQAPIQTRGGVLEDQRGAFAHAPDQAFHELQVDGIVVDDNDLHTTRLDGLNTTRDIDAAADFFR